MKLIPFSRYKISGHSMEPILKNGQIVWVNQWFYLINKLGLGDIVVFEQNGKELIKRVTEIKEDQIFVTGDNENDSHDSRSFGLIEKKKISGKVLV